MILDRWFRSARPPGPDGSSSFEPLLGGVYAGGAPCSLTSVEKASEEQTQAAVSPRVADAEARRVACLESSRSALSCAADGGGSFSRMWREIAHRYAKLAMDYRRWANQGVPADFDLDLDFASAERYLGYAAAGLLKFAAPDSLQRLLDQSDGYRDLINAALFSVAEFGVGEVAHV